MRGILATLLCWLAFLPGCDDPGGTGDAVVRWGIGLLGSCGAAGVETVSVTLEDGNRTTVAREEAPCEASRIVFVDVPSGIYRAFVTGVDRDGVAAYGGVIDDVRVTEGAESGPYVVRLSPNLGEIAVGWYFTGGRLCSAYGVEDVSVRAYRDDAEVFVETASCEDGSLGIESLDAGAYDILVEGLDVTGMPAYSSLLPKVLLPAGHRVEIEAPLARCEEGCL